MSSDVNADGVVSRDLQRDDAVLDLVSGWYRLANDALDAIHAVRESAKHIETARDAVSDSTHITLSVDLHVWRRIEDLARDAVRPVQPISTVRETEQPPTA